MCQLFYLGLKTRSQKFCYFTTSNAFEGNRYARHSKNMCPIQNLRIELTKYSVNYNRKPRQNWSLLSPLPFVIILLVQDNTAGEFHPLTREAVTQIVLQVIRKELRVQNNRHANYQNIRGWQSFQAQHIRDFCNRSGHVLAMCRPRKRQMQG